MNELIETYVMNGYDVQFFTLRTVTGLFHPESKDHCQIVLSKRLPGVKIGKRGGSAYAKGKISYPVLHSKADLTAVLRDLQIKVDNAAIVHKATKK